MQMQLFPIQFLFVVSLLVQASAWSIVIMCVSCNGIYYAIMAVVLFRCYFFRSVSHVVLLY